MFSVLSGNPLPRERAATGAKPAGIVDDLFRFDKFVKTRSRDAAGQAAQSSLVSLRGTVSGSAMMAR
jgi:hypothetical protein